MSVPMTYHDLTVSACTYDPETTYGPLALDRVHDYFTTICFMPYAPMYLCRIPI